MRFKRVDSAGLLVATEPDANTDEGAISFLGALLHFLELASNVRKVLGHFASLSLDRNFPCIDFACNCGEEQKALEQQRQTSVA